MKELVSHMVIGAVYGPLRCICCIMFDGLTHGSQVLYVLCTSRNGKLETMNWQAAAHRRSDPSL